MSFIKRNTLTFVFSFLFIISIIPQNALSETWWESKQEGGATDNIQVNLNHPGDLSRVTSASRANWESGYIEVMAGATADMRDTVNLGQAYSVATKTARHLAYEKLAETVNGLNLYSDATYDRELMIDSNLKTVLRTMIRNARVIDEKKSQFSDGSIWVEVTLGMKLFGEDGLIKPTMEWSDRQQPKIHQASQPKSADSVSTVTPATNTGEFYSGLVIDASGLGASPAMLPKIISEDGNVIYGTGEIDKEYVIKFGLMGYQNELPLAKKLNRVGKNPLVIKALKVGGKNKADFVVSKNDAERIKMALTRNDFLKECRVVAVIN